MPKVHFATATQEVAFERVCSNCTHIWTSKGIAGSGSHMEQSSDEASKAAGYALTDEIRDWRDNREHLCPECSHFSTDAMETHFKRGYVSKVLDNYKRGTLWGLFLFVFAGWLPLVLFIFSTLNPWAARYPARAILFLLLFLWFGAIAGWGLLTFIWGRIALASVRRKLEGLSDDALRELTVDCYRQNKNSLHVSIDADAGFFNAWLKKPLLYKADASGETKPVSG